ncbi:MAG: hypothetical protein GY829_12765, partial [Gammaproteobacteria bacterium]|nr:hypothetical protein [Gammaproteobacteria bacterium]
YATSSGNTTPTVDNYTAAGVTGVDAGNLDAVNAAIDAVEGTDADTAAEIQAIVDAVNALEIITDYAENGTTEPTETNYTAAGVTGVTADNLAAVNAEIDAVATGEGADTVTEIQAIVDGVTDAIDIISAYAADNTATTPTVDDYAVAGVTGVTADNLAAVNAEIDAVTEAEA